MAYCDVDAVLDYLNIEETGDNALITILIGAAQQVIDSYCMRTFEAASDSTRYFDSVRDVDGALLWLDHDICSVTTITNGDGTTISASHYVTEPRNMTAIYAIRLKASSGKAWTESTSGDSENAIAITGKWAYSTSAPADIVQACKRLAGYLYRQRDNAGELDRAVIAGNSTILPAQIPQDIKLMLAPYRRVTK